MRDKRFIAEHRGGPQRKEQHYPLISWACDCAENDLYLFGEKTDERLKHALSLNQFDISNVKKESLDDREYSWEVI
jgi:hypothetical protein